MKAFKFYEYGSVDNLVLEEIEPPEPRVDEVIVKLDHFSINPAEWHILQGKIKLVRIAKGFFRPRTNILGSDFSGTITKVGEMVKDLKVGDQVLGRTDKNGMSEQIKVSSKRIIKKHPQLDPKIAAAYPLAALTGLQALRDFGKLKSGESVLINGASGGIGTFTIQFAKQMGAEVTSVCSTYNLDLVRSLGSDHTIDYKKQELIEIDKKFDLIIELVGNLNIQQIKELLKTDGRCIYVGITDAKDLISAMFHYGTPKIGTMDARIKRTDLEFVQEKIIKEKIKCIIDKTYQFKDLPIAMEHLGSRRAKGKIVIEL